MRLFFLVQLVFAVVGALALWVFVDWRAASSYAVGVFTMMANAALLLYLWSRILRKKLIALSLFIIVFKYAILGVILYQILRTEWLSPLWFCVGIGTLMFAALAAVLES